MNGLLSKLADLFDTLLSRHVVAMVPICYDDTKVFSMEDVLPDSPQAFAALVASEGSLDILEHSQLMQRWYYIDSEVAALELTELAIEADDLGLVEEIAPNTYVYTGESND